MRDVWRVWALLWHANQASLGDDVALDEVAELELAGLLSGVGQFLDQERPPEVLEEFPGVSVPDAVELAWQIVSGWESQETAVVEFRLAMLDVRLAVVGPLGELHRGGFL